MQQQHKFIGTKRIVVDYYLIRHTYPSYRLLASTPTSPNSRRFRLLGGFVVRLDRQVFQMYHRLWIFYLSECFI